MNSNIKYFSGTCDGGADTLTSPFPQGAAGWFVKNDGTVDQTFTIGGQAIVVKAGEGIPVQVKARSATINGASGGYRIFAYEAADAVPKVWQTDTATGDITDGSVTTAKLADSALSADATGRAKMAASFFGLVAASIAHFVDGFWTAAAVAAKFAANSIAATKLEAGAAAAGIDGGDLKFTAATAVGALPAATLPVVLNLEVADAASGNNDWTGLVGKHEVIGFEAQVGAAGDAGNSYQLQTAGGVAITDAVAPGANAGDFKRCAKIDPAQATLANAAGIRIAHIRTAGSSAGRCRVWLVPVA